MKKTDLKQFSETLVMIAEIHDKEMSQLKIQLYFEQLKKFELSDIRKALSQPTRFMPKPIDIIEAIQGTEGDRVRFEAEVQADEVIKFLNDNGAREPPQFDDSTTRHLMAERWPYHRWGGSLREDEVKWWRKKFVTAYQDHEKVGEARMIERPMAKKLLGNIRGAEKAKFERL